MNNIYILRRLQERIQSDIETDMQQQRTAVLEFSNIERSLEESHHLCDMELTRHLQYQRNVARRNLDATRVASRVVISIRTELLQTIQNALAKEPSNGT